MKRTFSKAMIAMALAATCIGAASTASAGGDDARTRLRCGSTGVPDSSMDARFESRRGRATFSAQFEAAPNTGFVAGQALPVVVAGVNVGQLIPGNLANGDVGGEIKFDTTAGRGDAALPFPANFPGTISAGTSVVVGSLGCNLLAG